MVLVVKLKSADLSMLCDTVNKTDLRVGVVELMTVKDYHFLVSLFTRVLHAMGISCLGKCVQKALFKEMCPNKITRTHWIGKCIVSCLLYVCWTRHPNNISLQVQDVIHVVGGWITRICSLYTVKVI